MRHTETSGGSVIGLTDRRRSKLLQSFGYYAVSPPLIPVCFCCNEEVESCSGGCGPVELIRARGVAPYVCLPCGGLFWERWR